MSYKSNTSTDSTLPEGCTRGSWAKDGGADLPVIWVDFPNQSPHDPFHFPQLRKWTIVAIINWFAFITTFEMSSYSISVESMVKEIGGTTLQTAAGLSLYGWGFAVGPLVLAPITEENGRYPIMIISVVVYTLLHLMMTLGKNMGTVLVNRFLLGLAGCIGPTLTAGFIADIFEPDDRVLPMSLFTLVLIAGPGFGALIMGFVEVNLGWRWVNWIQMIVMAAFIPIAVFGLSETRGHIILQRLAAKLRKERGEQDGGRYTARSEVNHQKMSTALKSSISRPLLFLAMEPIVTFFALWSGLVWGVYFVVISGLPYVLKRVHGWGTQDVGIAYMSIAVGSLIGFVGNFGQEAIYKRRVAKDGAEARLWASMVAGVVFAGACFIFGATSLSKVHWIGPCIGVALVLAAAYTILQCSLVYLSNSYGTFASSAVAGMSFMRIVLGSSFACFTNDMFDTLTPRWSLVLMGGLATLFIPIPFVAYFKGPWIRDHSPYSKKLMEEER